MDVRMITEKKDKKKETIYLQETLQENIQRKRLIAPPRKNNIYHFLYNFFTLIIKML